MGVPALFRWLSKKYPKIVSPVIEEEDKKMADENGEENAVPMNMSMPNPNGVEFDNLYLDMNGIVHPCTHPEGKPAPETEEAMMLEIFTYTERIVNMIRPRKLLFMAIDGVAPRAKMNQQRSRRFRSAQEAKEKEEAKKESLMLWKAMGKEVSEEEQNKVPWDSNAITPGTPFMALLAASLRYWVVQKMNTDSGWKNIQVLISDATVPGEGEHKIMDFIRRQRSNPGHDSNTRHVIYGLDADLIMLSLATHEPYFRVLREDVFANDTKPTACRTCGQEGHYAAQCTGTKAEIQKPPSSDKKPFIFLDVSVLREYLEVELDVPNIPFPFSLEQAIDDWVLLIFFVGNDFLPHLPSLEIREGAIDTLLRIWKLELPRMGGYMTNHGDLELSRAQIILEGLARREDEIFRRRREAEERQDQNAKRRKLEQENAKNSFSAGPSQILALTAPPTAPDISAAPAPPPLHPSLPKRPTYDFAATADSIGLGAKPTAESRANLDTAAQALAGSNRDVVANRRAIRLANMSAAEVLKAELAGLSPVKPSANSPSKTSFLPTVVEPMNVDQQKDVDVIDDVPPGLSFHIEKVLSEDVQSSVTPPPSVPPPLVVPEEDGDVDAEGEPDPDSTMELPDSVSQNVDDAVVDILAGAKRKFEEGPGEPEAVASEEDIVSIEEDDDDTDNVTSSLALKVNPDGTVEQEDIVKLWEPGYKERYYRHKFGVELSDTEFRKQVTKCYIEGLSWVLSYYYQGTPSWQWYYPYHFAPFASDFEEIDKMDIKFTPGEPFKPFEQLMGVFPAASRQHIPKVFQPLMVDEDSPIIDFYPPTFEIDMNGKKLAWQGVALLPFIDEQRLLEAMSAEYPNLTEEEIRRNRPGINVLFASVDHPLYPFYEALYGKRKSIEPVPLDSKATGMSGTVSPNPDCIPGSTYCSLLTEQGLPDIRNDQSLSVLYFFPEQLTPHRSVILPGTKRPPRVLSANDLEVARRGGRGPSRGGWDSGNGRGNGMDRSRNDPFHSRPNNYYSSQGKYSYGSERNGSGRGRGDFFGGVYGGGSYTSRGGGSYQSSYSRPPYQSQGPPTTSHGNSRSHGSRGGYGGDSYPRNNPGGNHSYSNSNRYGYGNNSQNGNARNSAGSNSYSGYGGYGDSSSSGGYGGFGGYGSGNHGQSTYSSRGTSSGSSRGRGRIW